MINEVGSLAMNMHEQPGVFALLLGSGVSSGAGIPTGHAVTIDMIRRYASSIDESAEPEPESWFLERTGVEPRYSDVLSALSPTPASRAAILRGYFEPTEDDRQVGRKVPSEAHRAIARLVARGTLRVILTTNFDRLLEQALEEASVRPIVVHNASTAQGAPPMQHAACVLIKLHGDYLDRDIRNTAEELSGYDPPLVRLLDRVLSDYGLVVCGWSGEWDIALREAIERNPSRIYPAYWCYRGAPEESTKRLLALRGAVAVQIESADKFFSELERGILRLEKAVVPGQASGSLLTTPDALVREMKASMTDPQRRIEFHDLVTEQASLLAGSLSLDRFPVAEPDVPPPTKEAAAQRVKEYEGLSEVSMALFATGAYWADPEQLDPFIQALRAVAGEGEALDGFTVLIEMRRYQALLLFYAGGIAAVASGRYENLRRLQTDVKVTEPFRGQRVSLVSVLDPGIVPIDVARDLPDLAEPRYLVPMSEHLFGYMRDVLQDVIRVQLDYEQAFDRFEVLNALVRADIGLTAGGGMYFYIGRFGWKAKHRSYHPLQEIADELAENGDEWPVLRAGLFGGSLERATSAVKAVEERVAALPWF